MIKRIDDSIQITTANLFAVLDLADFLGGRVEFEICAFTCRNLGLGY